ncbi:hypothetical protein C7S20_16720 [Christiangramia fulva]|uniref:Uncharacterized protein n=1 Tax=Christiangramia fulva TaxID=2126553 RepID=A0A2R3Z973_9FLAO|nr:hypothetical protein C7S20_16720 [Christiangramia fulva]
MTEVGFAKKTHEYTKIKDFNLKDQNDKKYFQHGLSVIFTKASNMVGIKDPISPNNKQDILELILSRFGGLSLEEIDYAFKIDRYGTHGEPTPHFQLFNAQYVSTILIKYKVWLRNIRGNNNLPISKPIEKKSMSEVEKALLVLNGIIECFEEFKISGKIPYGKAYVYDVLYKRGLLPIHTKRYREKIKRKAIKRRYKSKEKKHVDRKELKSILHKIQIGQNNQKIQCKEIVLETFFKKLNSLNKTIEEVL